MEVPLKVEYSLTDFGKSLTPVVGMIAKWGRNLAENEGVFRTIEKEMKKQK
jgi:DNA-binding HxlR family transcriptional regulator